MKWAECLTLLNTMFYILPIIFNVWKAWKYDITNKYNCSDNELRSIEQTVRKLNFGSKKFNINGRTETIRNIQEGSK